MKQALIVIDVQESFRQRPYWQASELPPFLSNLQLLINRSRANGVPVVQVFHEEASDDASDPFSPASGFVRTLAELDLTPTAVFRKTVHSALYAKDANGMTLESWLRQTGIEEVLITGIRTEQCCETTARHASDAGFKVQYIADATLTFSMRSASGREFSPADIRERTELVLSGRFATIVPAATALL